VTDLVARLRRRDSVARRDVVNENARRLCRASRARGSSTAEAEDLAQEGGGRRR
jgi:DNA-directed RNA polymerase specialized sigma24 family protein